MRSKLISSGTRVAIEDYLEALSYSGGAGDEWIEEYLSVERVGRIGTIRALSESPLAIAELHAWSVGHSEHYPEECAALDSDIRAAEALRVA
jgi:hypothetical protein